MGSKIRSANIITGSREPIKPALIAGMLLFSFLILSVPGSAEVELTATREFSSDVAAPGSSFSVTVVITAHELLYAPSVAEKLPEGWTLVPVSGGSLFKASTNEWVWVDSLSPDESRSLTYKIEVPENAVSGIYTIEGTVSASKSPENGGFIGPGEIDGNRELTIEASSVPQTEKADDSESQPSDYEAENTRIIKSLPLEDEVETRELSKELPENETSPELDIHSQDVNPENAEEESPFQNPGETLAKADEVQTDSSENSAPGFGSLFSVFILLISQISKRKTND